ncbi:MAG: DsbA family oxidoreductase, partial [Dokdonella sp.]
MTKQLRIDFVSDISCPWCAVGLASLQQAMTRVPDVDVDLHFQPFELNPNMPTEGQNSMAQIAAKYNIGFDEVTRNRERIRERGAELGFAFNTDQDSRVYNTFDSHRLLHWAGTLDARKQLSLKEGLLTAYFTDNEDVSDRETLVRIARDCGLDSTTAG